jgi:hypothetical protein
VTLPPGCARLATRPPPTGSGPNGKTMGMIAVACFNVGTAVAFVTMTSTLRRTNSAAISVLRSGRPSNQRYSNAMVRPSIQPSSRSRPTRASVHGRQAAASVPRTPIVGSLLGCCARALSGHAAAAPPSATSNSRRLMVTIIRPSRARCVIATIPRHERAVLTARHPARAGRTPGTGCNSAPPGLKTPA